MKTLRHAQTAALVSFVALSLPLAGCSANDDSDSSTEQAATVDMFRLPAGDPCRQVLLPLAKAVTASSVGLSRVERVDVKLTSETENRDYLVEVDGRDFTVDGHVFPNKYEFTIQLSNDSSSGCLLQRIEVAPGSAAKGETTPAAATDLVSSNAPISLPQGDVCNTTLHYLAEGTALSTLLPGYVEKVVVTKTSETDVRDYDVLVDGKSFMVKGTSFNNDFHFKYTLDNDSSFGCLVLDVRLD